jgi:hypothetical protein
MEMVRVTENIVVRHCIYWTIPDRIMLRRSWNFKYNLPRKAKYVPLPLKFHVLLLEKCLKWGQGIIEFTYAHDMENEIWTIAIVHPRDNFNRKIGYRIVIGRLERYKGERPKMRKSGLEEMHYYKELPQTIYQLKREAE